MSDVRAPVLKPVDDEVSVQLQLTAWTARDLVPDYRYVVQQHVASGADTLWVDFLAFLDENSELLQSNSHEREDFKNGFKRCMALTRLFIDSLYVTHGGD